MKFTKNSKFAFRFFNLEAEIIFSSYGNQQWKIGKWYKVKGPLELCKWGFHGAYTLRGAIRHRQGNYLGLVEYKGDTKSEMWGEPHSKKFCAREMRLVKLFSEKDLHNLMLLSEIMLVKNGYRSYLCIGKLFGYSLAESRKAIEEEPFHKCVAVVLGDNLSCCLGEQEEKKFMELLCLPEDMQMEFLIHELELLYEDSINEV